MSQWRPRLEYFSLTRLISAYSRRTFRVVPGQLEAFEGSWPPLLQDPGSGCGSLWVCCGFGCGCGWLWLAVAGFGCGRMWHWCGPPSTVPDRATGSQQCQTVPPGVNPLNPRATGSEPPRVAKPVGA